MPAKSQQPEVPPHENSGRGVRATEVLRARRIWIGPVIVTAVFAAAIAAVYIGSVVNPTGHLHGLPVRIVDQDSGAVVDGRHLNVGASLTGALLHAPAVTDRLTLTRGTVSQADAEMNKGGAYATLVIPPTFTRSVLLAAGVRTPGSAPPPTAAVRLAENLRLPALGVTLASAVLTPAISAISTHTAGHLSALATPAAKSNPILASRLANPIALNTTSYHPLPGHSAAGLSA